MISDTNVLVSCRCDGGSGALSASRVTRGIRWLMKAAIVAIEVSLIRGENAVALAGGSSRVLGVQNGDNKAGTDVRRAPRWISSG